MERADPRLVLKDFFEKIPPSEAYRVTQAICPKLVPKREPSAYLACPYRMIYFIIDGMSDEDAERMARSISEEPAGSVVPYEVFESAILESNHRIFWFKIGGEIRHYLIECFRANLIIPEIAKCLKEVYPDTFSKKSIGDLYNPLKSAKELYFSNQSEEHISHFISDGTALNRLRKK